MPGELVRPGHPVAASAAWQILHDAGTGPAPRRAGPVWKQFLSAQVRGIIAAGFAHAGTVLLRHLRALIIIEHGTRRVHNDARPHRSPGQLTPAQAGTRPPEPAPR